MSQKKYSLNEALNNQGKLKIQNKTLRGTNQGITELSPIPNANKIETVFLSNNCISSLKGIENFVNIQVLALSFNKISKISELNYLKSLHHLVTINFSGNPITKLPFYQSHVVNAVPSLHQLDGNQINDSMRQKAINLVNKELQTLEKLCANDFQIQELEQVLQQYQQFQDTGIPSVEWLQDAKSALTPASFQDYNITEADTQITFDAMRDVALKRFEELQNQKQPKWFSIYNQLHEAQQQAISSLTEQVSIIVARARQNALKTPFNQNNKSSYENVNSTSKSYIHQSPISEHKRSSPNKSNINYPNINDTNIKNDKNSESAIHENTPSTGRKSRKNSSNRVKINKTPISLTHEESESILLSGRTFLGENEMKDSQENRNQQKDQITEQKNQKKDNEDQPISALSSSTLSVSTFLLSDSSDDISVSTPIPKMPPQKEENSSAQKKDVKLIDRNSSAKKSIHNSNLNSDLKKKAKMTNRRVSDENNENNIQYTNQKIGKNKLKLSLEIVHEFELPLKQNETISPKKPKLDVQSDPILLDQAHEHIERIAQLEAELEAAQRKNQELEATLEQSIKNESKMQKAIQKISRTNNVLQEIIQEKDKKFEEDIFQLMLQTRFKYEIAINENEQLKQNNEKDQMEIASLNTYIEEKNKEATTEINQLKQKLSDAFEVASGFRKEISIMKQTIEMSPKSNFSDRKPNKMSPPQRLSSNSLSNSLSNSSSYSSPDGETKSYFSSRSPRIYLGTE